MSGAPAGESPAAPVRVAIVDDHQMLLDALPTWLAGADAGIEVAASVSSWPELLGHPALPVDVVMLDLQLNDGVPAPVKIVTLASAGMATVVISTYAAPAQVRSCIEAGALSYLPKSEPAAQIVAAVQAAARGESFLTPALAALLVADREADSERGVPGGGAGRGGPAGSAGAAARPALSPQETRALVLYASGLPMKSVARRLGVSFDTAKGYVDRVREKYSQSGREARTKIELHRVAMEDGLLGPEPDDSAHGGM